MYFILPFTNRLFIFHPYIATQTELTSVNNKYADNFIPVVFETDDKLKLYGGLINKLKKPSWNDIIFLYSHGNGGWIGNLMEYDTIKSLSKYGSVLIYDYRGFGASQGTPSENGLYTDIFTVWKYLTIKKNISEKNIIIFGHSLGTSVSSKLVSELVNKKKTLPRALILEAPFTTMKNIAQELMPSLAFLLIYGFNNINNLKIIKNKIPTCLFHSKLDETIPYEHSLIIKQTIGCQMIKIDGPHCAPQYNENVREFLQLITNS